MFHIKLKKPLSKRTRQWLWFLAIYTSSVILIGGSVSLLHWLIPH